MGEMTRLLALLFLPLFAHAAAAPEPWNGVIQDAQKYAVAKNRKMATGKILNSLKTDKWTGKGRAKLLENLKALSEVFFTDQGQRLFETGQSLAFENQDTAMARFREALGREDGNIMILNAIARLQLGKKDCTGAEQTLHLASDFNPFDPTLKFLQAKTFLCEHKPQDALALLKAEAALDDVVSNTTLASAMFEAGAAAEATGLLHKAAAKDGSYPEVHYWIWKVAEDKDDSQGEKYVALCKNLNLRTRRKYMNEPRLCGQTQEVEDALKATQKNTDS